MKLAQTSKKQGAVCLLDDGGQEIRLPYIWLRDNCPSGFHEHTQERAFDLLSVAIDIEPQTVTLEAGVLTVDWGDHVSAFDIEWLDAYRPGQTRYDPADIQAQTWDASLGADGVPRANAHIIMENDLALANWMRDTKRFGLSIVEGLDDDPEAGMAVARRIAFLRETNFGKTFQVKSKPNPNNLAYTSDALPLHTDLPNQELPPGFQFLHCLANDAVGGGSIFADGVAIAEDLRSTDPEAFHLLSSVSIPFRFHDQHHDIRRRQCVITLREDRQVSEVCYNAHIADIFDLPSDIMADYYRAYRAFMAKTRDPSFVLSLALRAGEMVVFDNRRALHGREAFDPSTGYRHLHGCYVDRGDFDSRLRVLSR